VFLFAIFIIEKTKGLRMRRDKKVVQEEKIELKSKFEIYLDNSHLMSL
jgi:hypothetical protein